MIELTYAGSAQTVTAGNSIPFNTATRSTCNEKYRAGSSLVTLTRPGKYLVVASANVATTVANSTASVGIAVDGDVVEGTTVLSTPSAINLYNNVATQTIVEVFPCCCATVSLKNSGTAPFSIANQNMSIVRIGGTNA